MEKASLALRSARCGYIHATNVGMHLDDTDLLILTDIAFGVNSLITGVPSEVAISGLEVAIIRGSNGWTTSPLAMFLYETMQNCRPQMLEMTVAAISRPTDLNV